MIGRRAKSSLEEKLVRSSKISPTTGIMLSIPPPNCPANARLKHMCHDHRSSSALKSQAGQSLGNSWTISLHTCCCFLTLVITDGHLSCSTSSSSHSQGKFFTSSTSGRRRMYPQIALLLPFLFSNKSFKPNLTYHLSYRSQKSAKLGSGQASLPLTHKTALRGSRITVSSGSRSLLATTPRTSPYLFGRTTCSNPSAWIFLSSIQSST
mmetsp:Transcript_34682/g.78272  ORF Transcript_34682/g.78272 Transcript_34682/m.78272 type:complete len:209 (+) Transcript_34682:316-942(+)